MHKLEEHSAARATDILSRGPETPELNPQWQKYFDRLTSLRERISGQRSAQIANAHTAEPTFAMNPADRGTDEYDAEAAFSLISSGQNALFEIDQALKRIRDGAYGICEATGKPIAPERLGAIPWTRFARDVEEQLEKQEQARKPKHAF